MAVYKADESFDCRLLDGASCAFGVFDGLHVGHRHIIDRTLQTARSLGGPSIALTFDIDPDEVFHPDRLKKLMRNADRIRALGASGVDHVVVFPFTPDFYSKDPAGFLESAFGAGTPASLHVGVDFRFGAHAAGTVEDLRAWGEVHGCRLYPHDLVSMDGQPVTSTRIRTLLAAGDIAGANRLLGHAYTLAETVRRGRGEGADLGFATANLQVKPHDRVLGEGVYAAYVQRGDERYKAAVSVGVSPTFQANSVADVEVHLIDFSGNLVGDEIEVQFVAYLRPMVKFDSVDELVATVMDNIRWVRENL